MGKKIAVIDLGSNSVRLSITEIYSNKSYKKIFEDKENVRLSEKMGKNKILQPDAMERTISRLEIFCYHIRRYQTDVIIAVATAAVRAAANQEEFLRKVREKTGLEFKILTGDEECYYDYMGVIHTMPFQNFVMLDTGGGSSEVVLVKNGELVKNVTLPLGSVVLSEAYNDISHGEMVAYVSKELEKIGPLPKNCTIIGLGGCIRCLAKIDKRSNGSIDGSIHQYELSAQTIKRIYKNIRNTPRSKRKYILGMSRDRSDIILAGITPLYSLMKKIDSPRLLICGFGVREGLFFEQYHKMYGKPTGGVLDFQLTNLSKLYHLNNASNMKSLHLAMRIFELLQKVARMSESNRMILETACRLQDIGITVDFYNHQKYALYLIENSTIFGLDSRQKFIAALTVAQVGNRFFSPKGHRSLSLSDIQTAKKLALMINIANVAAMGDKARMQLEKKTLKVAVEGCVSPQSIVGEMAPLQRPLKLLYDVNLSVEMNEHFDD